MSKRDEYLKYLGSIEWKVRRNEAMERSEGFCEFCGDIAMAVHHSKYPKKYGEEHPANLISVCKRCHDLSHGIRHMEKITDAKIMSELAPNGIDLRYVLSSGRVYASAKSWSRALQVPFSLKIWFETGLARTSMMKKDSSGGSLEMEYQGTAVYRWHAVAEQLRSFDRRWYSDQYRTESSDVRLKIEQFHKNYETLVAWGYDLQERALSSMLSPTRSASDAVSQEMLIAAIKEAVAPRLRQHDEKLLEHDIIIREISETAPFMRDPDQFITVKQAIVEKGMDADSMPYYPSSRQNLSGLVGQTLKSKNAETGGVVASRGDSTALTIETNTYRRKDIYEALSTVGFDIGRQRGLEF